MGPQYRKDVIITMRHPTQDDKTDCTEDKLLATIGVADTWTLNKPKEYPHPLCLPVNLLPVEQLRKEVAERKKKFNEA